LSGETVRRVELVATLFGAMAPERTLLGAVYEPVAPAGDELVVFANDLVRCARHGRSTVGGRVGDAGVRYALGGGKLTVEIAERARLVCARRVLVAVELDLLGTRRNSHKQPDQLARIIMGQVIGFPCEQLSRNLWRGFAHCPQVTTVVAGDRMPDAAVITPDHGSPGCRVCSWSVRCMSGASMSESMNGNGDRPVTRSELRAELAAFEQRLDEKLDQKLDQKLDEKLAVMRRELSIELAQHVNAVSEQNREYLRILDESYRDLPGRMSLQERELRDHTSNVEIHRSRRSKR
jgi:hypothetical protein